MISRAWTPERYYPSIDFVLAQAQHYPLRIPTYRSSHRLRYHPYPRCAPPVKDDILMTTVDYRYTDADPAPGPLVSPVLSVVEEDLGVANLDEALCGKQPESPYPKERRLSTLVVELAFAFRRKMAIKPQIAATDDIKGKSTIFEVPHKRK